jgi:hypothetical protein
MGIASRTVTTIVFVLIGALHGWAAEPPEVTTCGETLKGKYRLSADLDCSSYPGPAITINGTLELRGFTLTGNPGLAAAQFEENSVIHCPKACKVFGPGTVTGGVFGIVAYTSATPPKKPLGSLTVEGVTVSNHAASCLFAAKKINAETTTISDCGLHGAATENGTISLTDSSITGAGADFVAAGFHPGAIDGASKSAKIRESQITMNFGPGLGSVLASSVERPHKVLIRGSTISDNGKHGVLAAVLKLQETTVENNCTSPGGPPCADVESCQAPKTKGAVTCGTSQDCGAEMSWGICSGD